MQTRIGVIVLMAIGMGGSACGVLIPIHKSLAATAGYDFTRLSVATPANVGSFTLSSVACAAGRCWSSRAR